MYLFLTQQLKVVHSLTYIQEVKNEHFENRSSQPWHNAKAPSVGIQWVPITSDAVHTSMTSPLIF